MTSGIPDYENELTIDEKHEYTDRQVIQSLAALPLKFAPGTDFYYSNTNYDLLGMIIRRVTGEPFDAYLHEAIFAPLGMENTQRVSNNLIPGRADGYLWRDGKLIHGDYLSDSVLGAPGGGLCSTV